VINRFLPGLEIQPIGSLQLQERVKERTVCQISFIAIQGVKREFTASPVAVRVGFAFDEPPLRRH